MASYLTAFGTATLTSALLLLVFAFFVKRLRAQQIHQVRKQYYKRKGPDLKQLPWASQASLLSVASLLIGLWSPIFGLVLLGSGMAGLWAFSRFLMWRAQFRLRSSVIQYLLGVEGLLRAGLSLPVCLERLSLGGDAVVHQRIRRAFLRFVKGEGIQHVISKIPGINSWELLHRAHRMGLPLLPIAKEMREMLEFDDRLEKKVNVLRQQAAANSLIAFALPWVVFAFLATQQPETLGRIIERPGFFNGIVIALLLQISGLALILRISILEPASEQQLLCFIQRLNVYLKSGLSLHWSWQSLCHATTKELSALYPQKFNDQLENIEMVLSRLATEFEPQSCRMWFLCLREQYLQGSDLGPFLDAMVESLQFETERRFSQWMERLPTRINLLGILFFFPSFFVLSIWPLVIEITSDFR